MDANSHYKKERRKDPEYRAHENELARKRYADKAEDRRAYHNEWRRKRWAEDEVYRNKMKAATESRRWEIDPDILFEIREQECFYCGDPGGEADHLIPRASGGEDRVDNLVPCCKSCNSRKCARSLEEFYALSV